MTELLVLVCYSGYGDSVLLPNTISESNHSKIHEKHIIITSRFADGSLILFYVFAIFWHLHLFH